MCVLLSQPIVKKPTVGVSAPGVSVGTGGVHAHAPGVGVSAPGASVGTGGVSVSGPQARVDL